ncbi:MAG: hypothetical protein R3F49_24515 [Planctomycetota bacterium]
MTSLQLRVTAGTWVLSIGAATALWSAEHAFTLEPGAAVALGAIELGPSATVRFAPQEERAGAPRLRLTREHFGATSIVIAPSLPPTSEALTRRVPTGAYRVEFEGRTPEALRLEPGQTWTPTWP